MFDTNGICSKQSAAFWDCYRKERGTLALDVPSSMAAMVGFDENKNKKQDKEIVK
jgi:hypothetical protein